MQVATQLRKYQQPFEAYGARMLPGHRKAIADNLCYLTQEARTTHSLRPGGQNVENTCSIV